MDDEINNEVTIVSLDKMIYYAMYEIRYRLSKRPDEKIIFSFVKEFLDGNEIAERIFWERLRTVETEGEIVNKPSKKGNSFFLPKSNSYASVNSSLHAYIRMQVLILVSVNPRINSLAALLHALKI